MELTATCYPDVVLEWETEITEAKAMRANKPTSMNIMATHVLETQFQTNQLNGHIESELEDFLLFSISVEERQ